MTGSSHPVTALTPSPTASRAADVHAGLLLTQVTLAWMTIEGAASLILGWLSGSLLLGAFGIDSVIELFSAAVLLWRLRIELDGRANAERVEAVERRASQLAGGALYALAAFIVVTSLCALIAHHRVDTNVSVWGIAIGIVAAIGMPVLARCKLRVAAPGRLNSKALRADAMEAFTCGYLSIALIVGLVATRLVGWWWLDDVAALALVPLLIKEGREAVTGGCACCHDEDHTNP